MGKNLGIDAISHATSWMLFIWYKMLEESIWTIWNRNSKKQQLQKYIDSIKLDVLKLTGIATDSNKDENWKIPQTSWKSTDIACKRK